MSETIASNVGDACTAVGVAVLDIMADGADRVVVSKRADGGYDAHADDTSVDMSICNKRCPACVEFTTVFQMPQVEYMGCLRSQSETTKLLNRHAAPLGQPCPFYKAGEE